MNSAQRISTGEDLWSVVKREKSADYWQAECILARKQLVQTQDRINSTQAQIDEALEVIDYMAEVIEALNLRLLEAGK